MAATNRQRKPPELIWGAGYGTACTGTRPKATYNIFSLRVDLFQLGSRVVTLGRLCLGNGGLSNGGRGGRAALVPCLRAALALALTVLRLILKVEFVLLGIHGGV